MNLWERINGLIRVEMTSAEIPRTMQEAVSRDLELFDLTEEGELQASFWIRRRDYPSLQALCEKTGAGLKIRQKRGFYWTGIRLLRRPVLLVGMACLLIAGMYLPSRVLFVRVEGNRTLPARQILYAAEDCGVSFGASRRYVRSEKVKNALLGAIPELSWAGVNTSGCVAVISVRERSAEEAVTEAADSIVAARDGYILSSDVTRGTGLIRPGETVRQGQTLISGYTDCGLCIRATGADGEVFARTKRGLEAVTPSDWLSRAGEDRVGRKYSLIFRKKRINLWKDSGICDATCGRIYREFYVTLPGGFRLPVALCVEEYTRGELQPMTLPRPAAEAALSDFGDGYLCSQMISGQIDQKMESVSFQEGVYRLEGCYDCTEMIGRGLKMGEANGKRD